GIDPELLAHTTERARPRRWIPSRLNSHPRGSLPKLVRVLPRCCHAPHPPVDSEPPPDPGRFRRARLRGASGGGALSCLTRSIDRGVRQPTSDINSNTYTAVNHQLENTSNNWSLSKNSPSQPLSAMY